MWSSRVSGRLIAGVTALLLSLLVLVLAWWGWGNRRAQTRRGLPPGPMPLRLLGNLLQLESGGLDRALLKLSRRWGPVFTVWLGPRPAVVLCGYAALRDTLVLQADTFSGRGAMPVFQLVETLHENCHCDGTLGLEPQPLRKLRQQVKYMRPWVRLEYGIVFSNGPRWRTLRNFALGALKEFGMGTRSIKQHIMEQAACLLGKFQATIGTPFGPRQLLDNAVSNVICSVVFGKRYGYGDPEFLRLLELFNDNFRIMSSRWGEVYNIFPSLLDWLLGPHHQIFQNFEELRIFISEQIQQHQETRKTGEPRDFIDCFLDQMDKQEETLLMVTHNLFFGGTETTSTTLCYELLILLKYPEVAELDTVVGRTRAPCLEDQVHLPYTNAVLHEIQRFISVLPLGLPRALTRDTHLRSHFLPKDPTQFKDPDCFNPTNFLDEKGEFQNNEAFMPFAPGKCMCLGTGLARSEIFLFLTAILQKFHLLPVESPSNMNLTPQRTGLGNVPPTFQLHLMAR